MAEEKTPGDDDPEFLWQLVAAAEDLTHADVDIGLLPFDKEHRDVLDRIKIVCQAVINEKAFDYLTHALKDLLIVTKRHFRHEEEYMAQCGYGYMAAHALDHRNLERQLEAFIDAVTGECSTVTDRLQHAKAFFQIWLVDHVRDHDRAIAQFMKQMDTPAPDAARR